jgi:DNA-binding CsgD family transcriptional regulator
MVGRSAERTRVERLVGAAAEGRGGALVVRGEAGIGKTALLAHAAAHAAADLLVLRATGSEAEVELPFSGLHELLRPVLGLLDDIPERQAAALRSAFGLGPALDARLLIGAGTLSLLAAAAAERPVLCLVDDAQWLDGASADALAFAARRVEADPVLLLFAAREGDPRTFEPAGVPDLALGGLAEDEAAELLAVAELPGAVVTALHRAVRGNPLALLELPGALSAAQRAGDEPLSEPLPLGPMLRAAFARRIADLPEGAEKPLLLAAAEPSGDLALIGSACARLGVDVRALESAEECGLVTLGGGRVAFRHPLVAAAVYHEARPAARREAHAALAEHVPPGDALLRAWHLAAASSGPDDGIAASLEEAARAAYARSGYRSAATMLERAAALTADGGERARRLSFSATLFFYDHRITRAVTLLEEAERTAPEGPERDAMRVLHAAVAAHTEPEHALATLLGLASSEEVAPRYAAVAAALAACAFARVPVAGEAAASSAALTAMHAEQAGDDLRPFLSFAAAQGFLAAGDLEAAAGLRDHALELALVREWRYEQPEEWVIAFAYVFAVFTLLHLGEHETVITRVAAVASETVPGDDVVLMLANGWLGIAEWFDGHWDAARAHLGEALRVGTEIGFVGADLPTFFNVVAAELSAARGMDAPVIATNAWAGYLGGGARGSLALGRGEYAAAAAAYEQDVLSRAGLLVLYRDVADGIEALLRADRLVDAQPWLERFVEQAEASDWPWALARAAHLQAIAAPADEAQPLFELALERHERSREPFARARTALALGERLRRAGLRRDAREHLRQALTTFETLGAEPWAALAARELRASGERARRRTAAHDMSALTPQELQVALVVAEGATNSEAAAALYLSPKTIEKHLGSVYSKLGLRSRTELARLFAEQVPQLAQATQQR